MKRKAAPNSFLSLQADQKFQVLQYQKGFTFLDWKSESKKNIVAESSP